MTPLTELLAANGKEPPEQMLRGEREFLAESVDTTWAPAAEAAVLANLAAQPGLKLISIQVECRTTQCRALLSLPATATSAGTGMPQLLAALGMKVRLVVAVPQSSNTVSVIAYLIRLGTEA
jgi:hypothetical protein